jgi:hypothetical protein
MSLLPEIETKLAEEGPRTILGGAEGKGLFCNKIKTEIKMQKVNVF